MTLPNPTSPDFLILMGQVAITLGGIMSLVFLLSEILYLDSQQRPKHLPGAYIWSFVLAIVGMLIWAYGVELPINV